MKLLMMTKGDNPTGVHPNHQAGSGGVSHEQESRMHDETMEDEVIEQNVQEVKHQSWRFGGFATKLDGLVPICKHILAVVLVKAAPGLFEGAVSIMDVSSEEIAGRAAGWGEK
jgi:hypothetical protein